MPEDDTTQVAAAAEGGQDTTQQQTVTGWKTELPTNLREHEAFAGYETKNQLWESHISLVNAKKDLEGKLSNAIPKLSENPTDDELAAYRQAIGVPDNPDDYEVELVDGMDDSMATWFKGTAHQLGMPKGMAKGLSAAWNSMLMQMVKAEQEAAIKTHDEALTELRKTWGEDAEKNAESVKAGYKVFGDSKALNELLQADITIGGKKVKVGNHPGMVDLILSIGKKVTPDTSVQGGPSKGDKPNVGMNYKMPDFSGG